MRVFAHARMHTLLYVWLMRQWELSSLMPQCFQNWLGPPACLQALNFLPYQTLKIYWNVILHNGGQQEVNKFRVASKLCRADTHVHSRILQILIECLLSFRHGARSWVYNSEQNRPNFLSPWCLYPSQFSDLLKWVISWSSNEI